MFTKNYNNFNMAKIKLLGIEIVMLVQVLKILLSNNKIIKHIKNKEMVQLLHMDVQYVILILI